MKTTIAIQNLKCGGCAATIKNKVSELEGVDTVEVDELEGAVSVVYAHENVLLGIKQKLAALGYPEVDSENGLLTKTKSFVSCAAGRLSKS
ncbi:heavy-metal-associated domain-containing protein [Muricauda sp. SCSIO 64092]|uniref:heavy-metal-associated domain-containing protein n=1 Tax=Allomuricauda sp. SCSIO 64092 TaxID=2908842 RepID=UPI001FF14D9C|nr:heavy-metal-associated domain-containing protein [Muricauda sp. SCSIO 64092]UOY08500.1 heavy-metal-associated domain-containing protein [Muricauda sp. SCSIO 64092]